MIADNAGQATALAGSYSVPAEARGNTVVLTQPPVFARRTPAPWLADTIAKLEDLATLQENWDSYGASPVDRTSIAIAQELICHLATFTNVDRPAVGATPDGEAGFSWDGGHWSLDADVTADGLIEYVYTDDRDDRPDVEASTRNMTELLMLLPAWD